MTIQSDFFSPSGAAFVWTTRNPDRSGGMLCEGSAAGGAVAHIRRSAVSGRPVLSFARHPGLIPTCRQVESVEAGQALAEQLLGGDRG